MKRTSVLGVESELAAPGTLGDSWLSADVGDLDGDKDSDLLVSNDGVGTSAAVHVNTLGVPDLIAPKIPKVGILGGVAPAGSKARVAAAQVFDNDANERFRDATAVLKFQINGGPVATTPARWSGGNLFRGTIPGYWFGAIQWWFEVTDRNANKGSSTVQNLNVASAGLANYGFGTPGCSGPQVMSANSVACPSNGDFQLRTTRCPPSALNLVLQSPTADVAGSDPLFLGITLHIGLFDPNLFALDMVSDPTGLGITPIPFPNDPSLVGYTGNFQTISLWTGPCTPSQLGLSTSNALAVTVQN